MFERVACQLPRALMPSFIAPLGNFFNRLKWRVDWPLPAGYSLRIRAVIGSGFELRVMPGEGKTALFRH